MSPLRHHHRPGPRASADVVFDQAPNSADAAVGTQAGDALGAARMRAVLEREDDLRSAALVLARAATDDGARRSLDETIEAFGFDRTELERELGAEPAAETRATPS